MNAPMSSSHFDLWMIAGWTMIHFLWLGTLVALAALLGRWLLRRASANLRYAVALTSLAMLAAMPVAIAIWMHENSPSVQLAVQLPQNDATNQIASNEQSGVIELKNIEPTIPAAPPAIEKSEAPIPAQPAPQTAQSTGLTIAAPTTTDPLSLVVFAVNTSVRYLPWLWLIGSPITFAVTVTGLIGTRRLRRASRPITDGPIAEALERLAASLRLTRRVAVAVCDRIAAPVLIGILRPIILVPPAALTGYSPDEIEMVLLHELAHVRRWDNLVNLFQRLVESMLFFHPAVWLISNWVRREREACCDALVVTCTDRPHAYAELLVALAAQMPRSVLFHPAASSAMAAGPLRSRIRRILKLDDDPMLISGKSFAAVLAALLLAATLVVLYLPTIGQAEQPTTQPTKEKETSQEKAPVASENNEAPEIHPKPLSFELKSGESGQPMIFLNDKPISEDEIRKLLRENDKSIGDQAVSLKADKGISYANVMKIIDLLESMGVKKLALDTRSGDARDAQRIAAADAKAKTLATFPLDWPAANNRDEYLKQLSEAFTKNLRIDLVRRGDHILVIGRPQPTEKDWPTILGEPPRKERVIAERAWQRFGLKLVPLTRIEYDYRSETGKPLGLLIAGGNVPKGLPAAAILTKVNETVIADMDQLFSWLETKSGMADVSVVCNAVADDKQYLFDAQPPDGAQPAAAASASNQPEPSPPATPNKPPYKFPSLEEQKLADLAWKRLQLELEPLGKDDLKWVQTCGYDGGVKVAAVGGERNTQQYDIKATDILVRLHIWPTTNMKDVAQILAREDLAELNPLKFYVVRTEYNADASPMVTGRITVKLLESGFGTGGQFPSRSDYFYKSTSQSPTPISVAHAETTLKEATEKRDAALKAKQEALTKRRESATASDDATAEAAKRELEKVDHSLEQAKRAFERAKRQVEELKQAGDLDAYAAKARPSVAQELAPIINSPYADQTTATRPHPVAQSAPNPYIPRVATATQSTPPTTASEAAPTYTPAIPPAAPQTTLPPTQAQPPLPSDPSPRSASWRDNRKSTPAESVFIAYDIPPDLKDKVLKYFDTPAPNEVRIMGDDRGRYIVQATQGWHDNFAALLKAAPKWHDPAVAKERADAPLVMKKTDDEDVLEWRSVGLSLKRNTEPRSYSVVNRTGVAVAAVAPGSPAAWADIRPGDVITEIGRFKAGTMPEVQSLLKALGEGFQTKKTVRVTFNREMSNGNRSVGADFTLGPEDLGAKSAESQDSKSITTTQTRPAAFNKAHFRYDGKTFKDWRDVWKTELSTEKRLEAVKALAAFGANGYGREAAEAIVEIAGQYDWTSIGGNGASDTLKKACLAAFGYPGISMVARPIPENDALLALLTAVDSKNVNDRLFAAWVLPVFSSQNKLAAEALVKLSSDADAKVRSYSFRVMNVDSRAPMDSGIPPRIPRELMSNDPQTARSAIKSLVKDAAWFNSRGISMEKGPALHYTPELFPLLFAPDESVRREARQALRFVTAADAPQIIEQLLSLLGDDARQVDHIEAIRALAAMGPKAIPALDKLTKMLSTSDAKMRIASAAAIKMIVGKDQYQKPIADVLGEELGITVVKTPDGKWGALPRDDKVDMDAFNKFTEDVIKEQELRFPRDSDPPSK